MTDQDAQLLRRLITRYGFGPILRELIRIVDAYCGGHRGHPSADPSIRWHGSARWYPVAAAMKRAYLASVRGLHKK